MRFGALFFFSGSYQEKQWLNSDTLSLSITGKAGKVLHEAACCGFTVKSLLLTLILFIHILYPLSVFSCIPYLISLPFYVQFYKASDDFLRLFLLLQQSTSSIETL